MKGSLSTAELRLDWSEASWDEAVCGHPVFQIDRIEVLGPGAGAAFGAFEQARAQRKVGLVSCRLPHDRLVESMLLEDHGFRFIEMVYRPQIELGDVVAPPDALSVRRAQAADLPALLEMAGSSFRNERFRMDPRLDPSISDRRYCNWVASALDHPHQELQVLVDEGVTVAFFVTEMMTDQSCYWHLNAIAPSAQGRGYGRRAWLTMMADARRRGATSLRSSIVARNHRVMNLYARLGFRFEAPMMTFHWTLRSAP